MPAFQSPHAAKSLFAATVFLSAALVFQIQPLMSKLILPWFGGSSSVWTVCLLFFQSLLFAGYLFAHGLVRWHSLRVQVLCHLLLVAVALLFPVLPSGAWKPTGEHEPTGEILWLLTWHVGLPYLVLSATGPLLQVWYARAFPGQSPYRLYALSNLGSLLGLATYPFLVDVWLTASQQVAVWRGSFVVYSVLCAACGWIAVTRTAREPAVATIDIAERVSRGPCLWWFGLAMVPSVLLAAVTNKLSTDVSPVPFLWVMPLTLYLVSLIVCFSDESWASRWVWGPASAAALLISGVVIGLPRGTGAYGSLSFQFAVHLGTLLCVCMLCHGELVRLKPPSPKASSVSGRWLTEFYLAIAAGGAAGGLFVAVVAPALFPLCVEHHLGLMAAALLPPLVWLRESRGGWFRQNLWIWFSQACVGLSLAMGLVFDVVRTVRNVHRMSRNFYGVVRVLERQKATPARAYYELAHGGIRHGMQFLDPDLARLPTTYYGLTSGVGLAFSWYHADRPRRIGIVGLGVGTLATYGRAGDVIDFYEIDPDVRDLATNFFRYLSDSKAEIHLIPGDARLSLERRPPQQYDLLVLDAFSGDAVPIHLLTAEAFEAYRTHLAADGILVAHVSNQYFDLRPVLAGHARRLDWTAANIEDRSTDRELFTVPSSWVLMSPRADSLVAGALGLAQRSTLGRPLDWTDSRHSLLEVLKSQ